MGYPFGETAELLGPSTQPNPYGGDDFESWDNPVVLETWYGVAIGPKAESEREEVGRSPVSYGLTLYGVPTDTNADPRNRVRVRGEVWEIDGEILPYVNPFNGWSPGAVVNLTRVEG